MAADRTIFHWGTRREMYAAMILQGLISNTEWAEKFGEKDKGADSMINFAVALADKLHAKLEEKK